MRKTGGELTAFKIGKDSADSGMLRTTCVRHIAALGKVAQASRWHSHTSGTAPKSEGGVQYERPAGSRTQPSSVQSECMDPHSLDPSVPALWRQAASDVLLDELCIVVRPEETQSTHTPAAQLARYVRVCAPQDRGREGLSRSNLLDHCTCTARSLFATRFVRVSPATLAITVACDSRKPGINQSIIAANSMMRGHNPSYVQASHSVCDLKVRNPDQTIRKGTHRRVQTSV
ncbi:hypothetical protein WOLCODRAFT_145804 [Wolfiporia cocos MD-104 SS10]|uniref:Uncharacterized protein n=1 Tax=Wolfiporia cocos (strain MD-104) TaxID=742152 RepID=A0A2H3J0A2_WOLCO|nr:hypothetical protein WOLCODRAFT_145804 [Wolfiporia cocos MD-104 SS10]